MLHFALVLLAIPELPAVNGELLPGISKVVWISYVGYYAHWNSAVCAWLRLVHSIDVQGKCAAEMQAPPCVAVGL